MAEDWFADVRKHVTGADENVVDKIVKYLGIALRDRDSSLVSFSDPEEVGRVRERYLRKKLALTASDDVLNEGLDWVKGLMSADRTKNRVTAYYLLAHYFGKLDLFGGPAGTSAATLGGAAAGLGAASLAALGGASTASAAPSITQPEPIRPSDRLPSEREYVAVTEPVSTASSQPQAAMSGAHDFATRTTATPSYAAGLDDGDNRGSGWPSWLTWLLIALAVIALFFLLKGCMTERTPADTEATSSTGTLPADADLAANAATASPTTATAGVPTGAGVVSGVRNEKPMLTVYFESAKSDVSNDMAGAAKTLKTYLDANPTAKLAVSGYNDPSGNAAFNAELSKKRAEAVAAALKTAGIPDASVELIKPSEATSTTVTPEQARRVEVTIQ